MWKLKPKTLEEEVAQNIAFLLSTPKGSVPMMRDLGIDTGLLDDPTPQAKVKLKAQIVDQIQKYEPRAKIKEIELVENKEGKLKPRLRWELRGDS